VLDQITLGLIEQSKKIGIKDLAALAKLVRLKIERFVMGLNPLETLVFSRGGEQWWYSQRSR